MPALQFKIQLKYLDNPPVWRRLLVPAEISFHMLHELIQVAFGWQDCHLYQFSPKGWGSKPVIHPEEAWDGEPGEDAFCSDETDVTEIFTTPKQKFVYIYDFGDDWFHYITLEKITADTITSPSCLAGGGACPPEDCGGAPGYMHLLGVLADPNDEEHDEMKEWLGMDEEDEWDANAFDLEDTNACLAQFSL